jgi:3-hydroxyisobutyrate dehydrogenase
MPIREDKDEGCCTAATTTVFQWQQAGGRGQISLLLFGFFCFVFFFLFFSFLFLLKKVGFIGLGNMGGHMASNLVKAGHSLVVFDVQKESVDKLVAGGNCKAASSPKEVAEQTEVLISMLPSSPHVMEVYEGQDGIVAGLQKGALCIDSSTIEPAVSRRVAETVSGAGGHMVDAPVSGGVGGAEAGTLTFMVGGAEADLERARALLAIMGQNTVHCGGSGTGQIVKICNNLILAISMCGVSEAMNLGVSLGMDPKVMASIINSSSGRCWSSDTYNPVPGVLENVPASNNYNGGFAVDLMAKDVSLAVSAAQQIKAPLPLGAASQQLYHMLSQQGYGRKDFSSVYDFLGKKK